ncbi:MAG: HEAT repeat domain-containing protein [Chitinispirillaceae bacterium]|jgi:small nuclear ribonucleoprotein (snRNP)-like protein
MNVLCVNKWQVFFTMVLLFLSVETVPAIQIKLNNGTVLVGDIVSQDDNSITVQVGPSRLSIAKSMVTEIAGLAVGTAAASGAPAASGVPAQQSSTAPNINVAAVTPGKNIEITLKSGARFKGTVLAVDDRLITLEVARGSRVDFYKSIIVDVRDFTSSSSTANPVAVPPAIASPAQPAPSSPAAQTPVSSPARTGAAGVSLGAEAAVPPGKKVEIALNNGARFRGTVLTADEHLVTLEVAGGSKVNFYRAVILDISDLSAVAPAASPVPAVPPVLTQTASSSQQAPSVSVPPLSTVQATSAAPAAEVAVIPGKNIEITLKTGSKFMGTVLTADDRVITLEVARGSKIDFYKSVIISIKDLTTAPVVSTNQVPAPSPLPPTSAPSIGSTPALPAPQVPAPAAPAPAAPLAATPSQAVPPLKPPATVEVNDALQKRPDTIAAMVTQKKPVTQAPAAAQETSVNQTMSTPAAVQPKPEEKKPVAAAIPLPTPLPPQQQPTNAVEEWTPKNVLPSVPISPPPAPLVQSVSSAPAALKKPEGKNELIFKNGTVLRGTIMSEGDRVLAFSTGDGVMVNILRRLIKTADGIPYAARSGVLPSYADTFSQLRTTAPVAATGHETMESIAGLCKSISDSSTEGRKKAIVALGTIRDTAAVPPLLTALKDNDASVRKLAAETLGDIRDPRAIQPLFAALQEPVDSVKASVVFSLKLHTEIPLLIGALDNQNSLVRDNAAYILFLITGKNLGNEKQAWVDWYAKGQ